MKHTILIAEPDAAARKVLNGILAPEGYDVVQAESGEQALALATAVETDIFLIAIEMPRMNGAVLCRELRTVEQYRSTPIIFFDGHQRRRSVTERFNGWRR